jgi:alpha-D-xyloside xylohydrolase
VSDPQSATLTSAQLSVHVQKGNDWQDEYIGEGQFLTSSDWHATGFVHTPQRRQINEQLSLGVGECVYGLGERFTVFVKMARLLIFGIRMVGRAASNPTRNVEIIKGSTLIKVNENIHELKIHLR